MKIALAALGFLSKDRAFNQDVIISTMHHYSGKADLLLFGEAFLQGFYGATFDTEHDLRIAVSKEDLSKICEAAKSCAISVSFGLIEKEEGCFFSSQITIGADGSMIDLFRRVSPGWKLPFAGPQYCEGRGFHTFTLMGKQTAVALCGDLWFDENIHELQKLNPDLLLWPVYTDYTPQEWNSSAKYEYASQAGRLDCNVLYVNSVCLDKAEDTPASGGAALFAKGKIQTELPAGREGVLMLEI